MICDSRFMSAKSITRLIRSMAPSKMRAVLVKGDGQDVSTLHISETETPAAKSDEVMVKIKAFGLNRMDIMQRKGRYPVPPGASTIIGVEFSGTVASNAHGFTEGEEVYVCFALLQAMEYSITCARADSVSRLAYVHISYTNT